MSLELSVFKNALTNQPFDVRADVITVVNRIRSEKYRVQTEHLRSLDLNAAREYKKLNFFAVTWSGIFAPTRSKANLQAHSRLICIDIDKLSPQRLTDLHTKLQSDEYTHVLFISPSGNGLKCVIKIDCKQPTEHELFFRQLSDYYRDCYGITAMELDASGKNVDRLCFLPYDPSIYYNSESELMPLAEEYITSIIGLIPSPAASKVSLPPTPFQTKRLTDYRKLDRCVTIIRNASDGGKHLALCKAATLAGGFIAAGMINELDAIRVLEDEIQAKPNVVDYPAAQRTIRTQIEFGKTQPVDHRPFTAGQQQKLLVASVIEWPPAMPLSRELLPVLPLEPDMIPEPLRAWLTDIAHRMKCPLDFTASASIVMLSALIGTRLTIKPKSYDDWTIVVNLWGAVIAEPSALKTPSMAEVLKPLNRLITESMQDHEQEQFRYQAEQATYEAHKKVYLSQEQERLKGKKVEKPVAYPEPPRKPIERRYMTSDATVEKLGELLNENPIGLLQFRDELTGLLAGWDRSGHEQDRAFYLEAWNGNGGATIDRIGRGTMHVKNVCVSLLGGIQPAKLTGYLQAATGYDNDGFVQRLQLAVYPDRAEWSYTDEIPNKQAQDRAFTLIRQLTVMDLSAIGYDVDDYNKFPYARFDAEGQAIFKTWLTGWETEVLPGESGLLLEHFTKYRSLMPSLALIFHVVNCADGKSMQRAVTIESAQMAVRWCAYLMSHARRIYGLLDTVSIEGARRIMSEIKRGKIQDGFKVRDIVRMRWSHLTTTEHVEAAMGELMNRHWLREIQPDVSINGRPEAPTYLIHPSLLAKRLE